jgi:hypothetical protein
MIDGKQKKKGKTKDKGRQRKGDTMKIAVDALRMSR